MNLINTTSYCFVGVQHHCKQIMQAARSMHQVRCVLGQLNVAYSWDQVYPVANKYKRVDLTVIIGPLLVCIFEYQAQQQSQPADMDVSRYLQLLCKMGPNRVAVH